MTEKKKRTPWYVRVVPPHLQKDPVLVKKWWKIIIILIVANVATIVVTWLGTVFIMNLGGEVPLWFWAVFMSFTIVTQITTWGIAVYTYYTAMNLSITADKGGATMTAIIDEFTKVKKQFSEIGITLDYFMPLIRTVRKEWKSLTEDERKQVIADAKEDIRKKIRELKNKNGPVNVPVPNGRVRTGGMENDRKLHKSEMQEDGTPGRL